MSLVPIREEDRRKSFYKYYAAGIAPNTPEDLALCVKGKPENAMSFADRATLQDTPCTPTGYYQLPEGGYLVASNIPAPDITAEMMWWWTAWYTLDSFRYSCWDPEDHFAVELASPADRNHILDPNVPLMEKTWGTGQFVTEAIGDAPAEPIHLHIKNSAALGFDLHKIGTDSCQYLSVATSDVWPVASVVALTLAKGSDGRNEIRERFWMGYKMEDGRPVSMFPPGLAIPEMEAMCAATIGHNFKDTGI